MGKIPLDDFNIPPVFVPAEDVPPPPVSAFSKRPAGAVQVGDLLRLGGVIWRVKSRRTSKTSPRIWFTLHPVAGGRPESESFFPREWIPAVLFDDEQPTKPMPPVR